MKTKNIIRKLIREYVAKILLRESEELDNIRSMMISEIFDTIRNKEKVIFNVIPKTQYHNALKEFMKFGEFVRFPEKYIFEWKDLVINNIAKLEALTAIGGHTSYFPWDDFYEVFNNDGAFTKWVKKMNKKENTNEYNTHDWGTAFDYLDEVCKIDDYLPLHENGQWLLSDSALEPLLKLGYELDGQNDANEIIVLIDRVLQITHPRGDLAEIFIEGGSESLSYINVAQ